MSMSKFKQVHLVLVDPLNSQPDVNTLLHIPSHVLRYHAFALVKHKVSGSYNNNTDFITTNIYGNAYIYYTGSAYMYGINL